MENAVIKRLLDASRDGDIDAVLSLLDGGAVDINSRGIYGMTALHAACCSPTADAMIPRLLERGADINARNNDGLTSLFQVSLLGQTATATLLLSRGADPSVRARRGGSSALLEALRLGHADVAMLLLEQGACVDTPDDNGCRALHMACARSSTELCKSVLERCTDDLVNLADMDGKTPLHIASGRGQEGTARELLARGALVDIQDGTGRTALRWACDSGRRSMAILLIGHMANVSIRAKCDGRAALEMRPLWRAELSRLYEQVNRAWLARKSFLFVLVGCGLLECRSTNSVAPIIAAEGSEEGGSSRDEVLRLLHREILGFL